jgi:hypothetical protein
MGIQTGRGTFRCSYNSWIKLLYISSITIVAVAVASGVTNIIAFI